MRKKEVVALILRMAFGGFLTFAAIAKIQAPDEFSVFLAKLGIATTFHIIFAIGITYLELILGMLCLLGIAPRLTLRMVVVLFLGFAGVIAFAMLRDLTGGCGCFGRALSSEINVLAMVRNVGIATIAFLLSFQDQRIFLLSNTLNRIVHRI